MTSKQIKSELKELGVLANVKTFKTDGGFFKIEVTTKRLKNPTNENDSWGMFTDTECKIIKKYLLSINAKSMFESFDDMTLALAENDLFKNGYEFKI